jgi:thioredoxin 2
MRLDAGGVIVTCASCGKANRLGYAALGKTVRCGQCKGPLTAPASPIEIERSADFDAAARSSALPLLVDFWAPWCGPCRMVAPELERVARTAAGRYVVVKVNTDEHPDIGSRFRIQSIPTLAIVAGGREIDRIVGVRPAADIIDFAERVLQATEAREGGRGGR